MRVCTRVRLIRTGVKREACMTLLSPGGSQVALGHLLHLSEAQLPHFRMKK